MAKGSIYDKVEKQYKAFIRAWHAVEEANLVGDVTDKQMADAWANFWEQWFVCRAVDLPKFVSINLALNERGVPMAYVMFDDPVMDFAPPAELKFEDLVANCWSHWRSKAADRDENIEEKLRAAFEKGLARAKKAKFE
jgi:hypothetical protein